MYKYMYKEAQTNGLFRGPSDHREIIDKYSKEGWRFVTAIPTEFYNNNGEIKKFDLVFEKQINDSI
ncbi:MULTISPECIES: DUF4177 domain-containing protein [Clostridium]|jgi:hypothetical protein|uniref:DUF4177 domain-containing protein n=1 Tax=Clostridium TaxID=1485 RepID=UPI000C07B0CE|nr:MULTISPECIES: DUF4177 domain-containing protein [Clostridium]MBU6135599.1 DUF4177 domain-containing protein [Clostridium tertium]MDB1946982.1 DUF4177 domain-containing protein [Clostridium tertium]MDI9215430.1 DUF4177 domain-containing protein [Clostridium tertium]MDU2683486.1 DUF4177 domain-containing protein [Clostridium sp.]MDU8964296.1 DUF4177 domain-containing protein [Clostridium sp.]